MSNVSNRHSVVPFISGESAALSNQRLIKVGYKTTKTAKAKFPSVCASVPVLTLSDEQVLQLREHVLTVAMNAQDGIMKSLYESSNGKLEVITDEELSFDAIIGFLEAESTGGRLTKESVISWFKDVAAETTCALLAEKLNYGDELTQDQMNTIEKHCNGYMEVFASLSGGKTVLLPKQIAGLRKVLGMLEQGDDMVVKLTKRLDVMEKNIAKDVALADIL